MAVSSNEQLRVESLELRVDRDSVFVAEKDTVKEITTITVQLGEGGDTVYRSVVTDRDRVRSRDNIATYSTKTEIVRDTVFIERRDSSFVKSTNLANPTDRASPFALTLKWVFWIIVAVIALMIVVRIRGLP